MKEVIRENAWLELNLDNIKYNCSVLKKNLKNKELMIILKSNSYNLGLEEIVTYLDKLNFNRFGVYDIFEAKRILKIFPNKKILIMGSVNIEQLKEASNLGIEISLTSDDILEFIIETKMNISVHLKVDTGLGRMGYIPEDALKVIEKIMKYKFIKKEGLFTHFSSKDEDYISYQIDQFCKLKDCFNLFKFVHAENTTTYLLKNYDIFNLARVGGAIYGLVPYDIKEKTILKQVLSMKSKIELVRTVPEGSYIGYDRSFITNKKTIIGIVSIGYSQGIDRALANKGFFSIKGKRYKIIGNVSMNNTILEIDDSIKVGDEVIIFDEANPIYKLAALGNKRIYENLFSMNIKKYYLEDI